MAENDCKKSGVKRPRKHERSPSLQGLLATSDTCLRNEQIEQIKRARTETDEAFAYYVQIQQEFQRSNVFKDSSNISKRTACRKLFSSTDNNNDDVDSLTEKIQETSL